MCISGCLLCKNVTDVSFSSARLRPSRGLLKLPSMLFDLVPYLWMMAWCKHLIPLGWWGLCWKHHTQRVLPHKRNHKACQRPKHHLHLQVPWDWHQRHGLRYLWCERGAAQCMVFDCVACHLMDCTSLCNNLISLSSSSSLCRSYSPAP